MAESHRAARALQAAEELLGHRHAAVAYGIPQEADLVFDVRFLPNPYYVPELKEKNGTDKAVRDYVFAGPEAEKFADKLEELLGFLLPCYRREGKSVLVIGIGPHPHGRRWT